jgi:hypothetical protein
MKVQRQVKTGSGSNFSDQQRERRLTMALGRRPDYNVYVTRQDEHGKSYTDVGAWRIAKDGTYINLQMLPIDGKLVLFPGKKD